ncbi:hypothetical protein AVEN_267691-1, partial [Araneus ventricosus]
AVGGSNMMDTTLLEKKSKQRSKRHSKDLVREML